MPAKMMQAPADRLAFKAFTNASKQQNAMLKQLIGGASYSKTKDTMDMQMGVDAPPMFPIRDQTVESIAEAAISKRLAFENVRSFQRSALGAVQAAVGGPAQTGLVGANAATGVGLRGAADPQIPVPMEVQVGPGSLRFRQGMRAAPANPFRAGMNQPVRAAADPRTVDFGGMGGARMPEFADPRRDIVGEAAQRARETIRQRQRARGGAEERKEFEAPPMARMFGAGAAEMQAQNLPQRTAAEAIPVAQQRDEGQGILGDPGGMFRGVGTANPNDMAQHATNVATPMGAGIQTQPQEFMADAAEQGVPPGVTVQQAAGIAAANQNVPAGGTATNQTPQAAFDPPMAGGVETPMEDVPTVQMNPMADRRRLENLPFTQDPFGTGQKVSFTEFKTRVRMMERQIENAALERGFTAEDSAVLAKLNSAIVRINSRQVGDLPVNQKSRIMDAMGKLPIGATKEQIKETLRTLEIPIEGNMQFARAIYDIREISASPLMRRFPANVPLEFQPGSRRVRLDPEAEVAALRGFTGMRSRAGLSDVAGSTITASDPRTLRTRSRASTESIRSIAAADPSDVPSVFRRAAAEAARSDAPVPGLQRAMQERLERRSERVASKRFASASATDKGTAPGSTLDGDGTDY